MGVAMPLPLPLMEVTFRLMTRALNGPSLMGECVGVWLCVCDKVMSCLMKCALNGPSLISE